jgi:hypothetical protein
VVRRARCRYTTDEHQEIRRGADGGDESSGYRRWHKAREVFRLSSLGAATVECSEAVSLRYNGGGSTIYEPQRLVISTSKGPGWGCDGECMRHAGGSPLLHQKKASRLKAQVAATEDHGEVVMANHVRCEY